MLCTRLMIFCNFLLLLLKHAFGSVKKQEYTCIHKRQAVLLLLCEDTDRTKTNAVLIDMLFADCDAVITYKTKKTY